MRKIAICVLMLLLLSGCAGEETFETVADEPVQAVMASPRSVSVQLPDDAVAPVLENDQEQVYLCRDYEIVVETLSSGDLDATVRHISGYDREKLTLVKTKQKDVTRYEFVWACAGEQGDRLGRAVILDDGQYHYCLSALRDAEKTTQVVWSEVFSSFSLT